MIDHHQSQLLIVTHIVFAEKVSTAEEYPYFFFKEDQACFEMSTSGSNWGGEGSIQLQLGHCGECEDGAEDEKDEGEDEAIKCPLEKKKDSYILPMPEIFIVNGDNKWRI